MTLDRGPSIRSSQKHKGPHLGTLAIVFTLLFNAGLYFVISFSPNRPHFPGPWESAETIVGYFRDNPHAVRMCAFLQFGSAIPLGIFTATMVSRLYFLGVKAAGPSIALFGGFGTSCTLAISALIMWVAAVPGIAEDPAVLRALYYAGFAIGGVGYSVPLGLLIAGVSIPAAFMQLLPRWLSVAGIAIGVIGELSWLNLVIPKTLLLIPLTRFPGFLWLIVASFALPTTAPSKEPNG